MTQNTTGEIEFVNDWSELENAVARIHECFYKSDGTARQYVDILISYDEEVWGWIAAINKYVPRLLTQYASLLELSLTLTEGWEQYASLQPKAGLYLPDHR